MTLETAPLDSQLGLYEVIELERNEMHGDPSPDHEDRLRDFFARHGGPGERASREGGSGDDQGWCEAYAKDGYTLRCDWSIMGTRHEMRYSESAPARNSNSPPGGEFD